MENKQGTNTPPHIAAADALFQVPILSSPQELGYFNPKHNLYSQAFQVTENNKVLPYLVTAAQPPCAPLYCGRHRFANSLIR
jgi:hypothetical protein